MKVLWGRPLSVLPPAPRYITTCSSRFQGSRELLQRRLSRTGDCPLAPEPTNNISKLHHAQAVGVGRTDSQGEDKQSSFLLAGFHLGYSWWLCHPDLPRRVATSPPVRSLRPPWRQQEWGAVSCCTLALRRKTTGGQCALELGGGRKRELGPGSTGQE